MIVYRELKEFKVDPNKPLTVVLGNFDGIHLGHQNLIKMATNISREIKGETLVLTFYPLPQLLFNPIFKISDIASHLPIYSRSCISLYQWSCYIHD